MDDLISRQAAIATAISGRVRTLPTTEDGEDWIRVNEVRESLLSLPSAQPEPCEDTVSRKAVEKMLKNGFPARGMWEIEGDVVKQTVCETLADALMELESLPSAQPEIIRCKDCEYGEQDEVGRWFCRSLGCQIGNEDGSGYCADAERRTDNANANA